MSYLPTNLSLMAANAGGAAKWFLYRSTDPLAAALAPGYITDADNHDMSVGDLVLVQEAASPVYQWLEVARLVGGAADLVDGLVPPAGLAPIVSPRFNGTPLAPTPGMADATTKLATTEWVQAQAYLRQNQRITLSGDAAGAGTSAIKATVTGLQGLPINAAAPQDGQVLAWHETGDGPNGGAWQPVPPVGEKGEKGDKGDKGDIGPPGTADAGGINGQVQINAAGSLDGITMSGDATWNTATGALALTSVNANVGTWNNVTINAKGLATAGANVAYLTGNQTITATGDATGSGTTTLPLTLATVNANVGSYTNANITVNAKGLITAAASGAAGGTGTVTSVAAGVGLTTSPSPIVGAGTVSLTVPVNVTNGGTGAVSFTVPSWSGASGVVPFANGTGAFTASLWAGTTGVNGGLTAYTDATSNAFLEMGRSSGTLGSPTATGAQILGSVSFSGYDGANWAANKAYVRAAATETWSGTVRGTSLTLATTLTGTNTTAARLTIDGTGNVVLANALPITSGGTGATTAGGALTNLGAAPINAPVFTGDARAVTAAPGDSDTSIATTAFVSAAITAAPNQTITLSGDIAGSGTAAITTTLPNVNPNVGTFNNVTLNAKGQATAGSNTAYLTASGVSGMTAGQIPIAATATTITSSGNLSGDVTTSTGSLATTLATVNANVGTFASHTVNAKGLTTAAGNLTGDVTTSGAAATIANNVVTDAKLRQGAALTVIGRSANSLGNVADIAGVANQVLRVSGASVLGFGAIDLSQAASATGVIQAASEPAHTGDVTNTAGSLALTIANSAVTLAKMQNRAASTLLGNPTGSAAAPSEITLGTNLSFAGTVLNATAAAGGLSGMTAGQIPIAATATTVTSSANLSGDVVSTATTLATTIQANAVTTTKIINSAVTYAKIQNVANNRLLGNTSGSAAAPSEITLPLSAANGGTGLASGTSGGIPYFNTTTSLLSSALLTTNALVKGGGAGAAPAASVVTEDGTGNVVTTGSGAAWTFNDRTTGAAGQWSLFANSGAARLYAGGADKMTVTNTGTVFATGLSTSGSSAIGTSSFIGRLTVSGAGQATPSVNTAGVLTNALVLDDPGTGAGNGGVILFTAASQAWRYAAIMGFATSGTTNTRGDVIISTRRNDADTTLTETARFASNGTTTFAGGEGPYATIALGGTTIGAPTGGAKGAGTLNATGVYAAGALLTSDARLKRDIEPVPDGCLDLVAAIEPKRFRFIEPPPGEGETPAGPPGWFDKTRWGFVAQDVEGVIPDAIETDAEGNKYLSPSDLLSALWSAVRELNEEVITLRKVVSEQRVGPPTG